MATILLPLMMKSNTTRTWPPVAHIIPGTPSMSARRAPFARPEKVAAAAIGPCTSLIPPICATTADVTAVDQGHPPHTHYFWPNGRWSLLLALGPAAPAGAGRRWTYERSGGAAAAVRRIRR